MLKEEFDTLIDKFTNLLFSRYMAFMVGRQFGQLKVQDFDEEGMTFMQMELLSFVYNANKKRHPEKPVLIPSCINECDFNAIISNVKNKLL